MNTHKRPPDAADAFTSSSSQTIACSSLRLARYEITWHLGFEELVLVALDIENSDHSAFLGKQQPSRDVPYFQLYLNRRIYDPAEDIKLMECSCSDELCSKFLSSKLNTLLGGQVTR